MRHESARGGKQQERFYCSERKAFLLRDLGNQLEEGGVLNYPLGKVLRDAERNQPGPRVLQVFAERHSEAEGTFVSPHGQDFEESVRLDRNFIFVFAVAEKRMQKSGDALN